MSGIAVGFGALFALMGVVIGIGGTVLWIWMLIDCATKEPDTGNDKIIWILIIIFTHWLGALIYFLVRRPKRIQEFGQ
ncbi:MAG: PLDc N-terminal domain-containing protein [Lentisphaeria bacterium]|nr:PLDc N-terminal domain-containing protein [Lentisphaeria bacterium]